MVNSISSARQAQGCSCYWYHYTNSSQYCVGPSFAVKTWLTHWAMDSTKLLRCAVISATKMLATDPLSPLSLEVGPPWIECVCPAHRIDAQLDWDLGILEAKSTPQTRCAPDTILESFLFCGRVHYLGHIIKRPQAATVTTIFMTRCAWSAVVLG